jgi:hypothetical protein
MLIGADEWCRFDLETRQCHWPIERKIANCEYVKAGVSSAEIDDVAPPCVEKIQIASLIMHDPAYVIEH